MFASSPLSPTNRYNPLTHSHQTHTPKGRDSSLHLGCVILDHIDHGNSHRNSPLHRTPSKSKRISGSKLFAKAHQVSEKESYLTSLKT